MLLYLFEQTLQFFWALGICALSLGVTLGGIFGWCWFHDRVLHPHIGADYDEARRRQARGEPGMRVW
jgi:hypothetical protein